MQMPTQMLTSAPVRETPVATPVRSAGQPTHDQSSDPSETSNDFKSALNAADKEEAQPTLNTEDASQAVTPQPDWSSMASMALARPLPLSTAVTEEAAKALTAEQAVAQALADVSEAPTLGTLPIHQAAPMATATAPLSAAPPAMRAPTMPAAPLVDTSLTDHATLSSQPAVTSVHAAKATAANLTVDALTQAVSADAPSGDAPAWLPSSNAAPATAASSTIKLIAPAHTPESQASLLNGVGERIQWQLQRGQEQASIQLHPTDLGRIDILIRQEGQALRVAIHATHREVVQQLQGISDQLKQELSMRQSNDVAVQISDGSREGDARQRARQEAADQRQQPGRALSQDGADSDAALFQLHELA